MKKTLAALLIGVAALLATVTKSSAQSYAQTALSVPPVLANGTTNYWNVQNQSNAPAIFCGKQQNVGVQFTTFCNTGGATNLYSFAHSLDGIGYDTNSADLILFSNQVYSGTFSNTTSATFTSGGFGWYKLVSVAATINSGNDTNAALYSLKLNAP